jgi:hypothetical protein
MDWRITIKSIRKKQDRMGVDSTHLAQDRDQWCIPVNMVKNLQVP